MNGEWHDSGTVSLKKAICICLATHCNPGERLCHIEHWFSSIYHYSPLSSHTILKKTLNYHLILNCSIPSINQKHLRWKSSQIRSGNPQQQPQSKAGKAMTIMAAFLQSLSLNWNITVSTIKPNIKQHQNLRLFNDITLEVSVYSTS